MAKYKVTCYHHRRAIVKGDLEAETIIDSVEIFTSKKAIVEYLSQKCREAEKRRYETKLDKQVSGNMPSLQVYTNDTWTHENTGEDERESYWYRSELV